MKLSLKSALENVQKDCENISGLESLIAIEQRQQITEECNELFNTAKVALEVLDQLQVTTESLKECGYSDEWFDTINLNKRFTNFVQLDVPKFMDPKMREQAVMEGLGDTILDWLRRIWEAIKKFFAFVRDCIHKVFQWMGLTAGEHTHRSLELASKVIDKMEDREIEKMKLDPKKFYSAGALKQNLDRVNTLMNIIVSEDYRNDARLNERQSDCHAMTIDLISEYLENAGIKSTKLEETGFIIKDGKVVFAQESDLDKYRLDKYTYILRSKDRIQDLINATTNLESAVSATRSVLENANRSTRQWEDACKKQKEKDEQKRGVTPASFNRYQLALESLKIITAALKFQTMVSKCLREMTANLGNLIREANKHGGSMD